MKNDDVLTELNLRYSLIMESEDSPLLLANKVAGYCKIIPKIESMNIAIEELKIDANSAYKTYFDAYTSFKTIWNKYLSYISKQLPTGIDNVCRELNLPTIKKIEEGFPLYDVLEKSQIISYRKLTTFLLGDNKENSATIQSFTKKVDKCFYLMQSEKCKFNALEEIEIWGCFYQMNTIAVNVLHESPYLHFLEKRFDDTDVDYYLEYQTVQNSQENNYQVTLLNRQNIIPKIKLLHNYLVNKINCVNSENSLPVEGILPKGWSFEVDKEGGSASILLNNEVYYTFPRIDSNRYNYFSTLWNNFGLHMSYPELYRSTGLQDYPKTKGDISAINKKIRDEINKLKTEFKKKNVPVHLSEKRGWYITI